MVEPTYSTFESRLQVRPDDIDMNGHAHNSRYLDYVLAARFDQMQRCYGMGMTEFIERGFSWFVKTAHVEHKRPLFMGDWILVRTRISEVFRRGVRIDYEIIREHDERLSAEGYFEYQMVSMETGRPLVIPEDIVERYSI